MTKRKRRQVVKWKPVPEYVQIFKTATGKFPDCVGTYPDECPEKVDVTRPPCSKCPVFIESPNKKKYMAMLKKGQI